MLEIKSLNKNFDGIRALDNFSCNVKSTEILGLIGPNGAGKTTLFNVITGFIPCDSGSIRFSGKNIVGKSPEKIVSNGISRTFQIIRLIRQLTVLDNVLLSFRDQPGENLFHVFFRNRSAKEIEAKNKDKALALLESTGLAEKAHDPANDLSYGQQKLLSVVCCLASGADLLLLDEPVAGINPEMIERILTIIAELPEKGKSVILIEHNMDVIMEICNRVIFMDAGAKISEGTPEEVRNDPKVIEAYLD